MELQDNPSRSLLFVGAADPEASGDDTPAAGNFRLVIDDTGAAWIVDETDTATQIGAGFSGDAGDIPFTPVGTIAATDVQAAIAEVASEAAAPTFIGARCRGGSAQSLTTSTFTPITLDTEDYDTDTMHFTSAANLTGTLAKTASSADIVGTSTLFTSELTVGQIISVPGTAAERRVVTVITSNTALTCAATFANTASGQTAARVNSGIVIRTAGKYRFGAKVGFATHATGARYVNLQHIRGATATTIGSENVAAGLAGDGTRIGVADEYACNQWDWVEIVVFQASGGALNTEAAAYSPVLTASRLGA